MLLKQKEIIQFNILKNNILNNPKKIIIKKTYLLDDETYFFFVLNKNKYQFFLLTKNDLYKYIILEIKDNCIFKIKNIETLEIVNIFLFTNFIIVNNDYIKYPNVLDKKIENIFLEVFSKKY